jgi:PIN domain nuclease of toxin-antitoxin system
MKILLDTNVLLWFVSDDAMLSLEFKEIIENNENEIFVSIASLWEITIKLSIGKLEMDESFESFFKVLTQNYGFKVLQITENHLYQYLKLPLIHRDPFDRLIYSQAVAEKIKFLFTDEIFRQYDNIL